MGATMKDLITNLYKATDRLLARVKRSLVFLAMAILSQPAWALKASDLTNGITYEFSAGVKLALLIIAGIGIVTAGSAIISWIIANKRNEPAKWQLGAVIGGAATTIVPLLILAFAGSLSDGQGDAEGVFNDLNINY
jgi:hypothetical protein